MRIEDLRHQYHEKLNQQIIRVVKIKDLDCPNFADLDSDSSRTISAGVLKHLSFPILYEEKVKEQRVGNLFEEITKEFIEAVFSVLQHLRPGAWIYTTKQTAISGFAQYEHLKRASEKIKKDRELVAMLGSEYIIKPDIIVARLPVPDALINSKEELLSPADQVASLTNLREKNQAKPILHASISCKWTIRSDRSQNTRTEALNLIRNRKGTLPHIVAVVAEPLPTRIATLALGTGDLDCVYHFALHELRQAVAERGSQDQREMLEMLVEGSRLRDISDLPFDLAV